MIVTKQVPKSRTFFRVFDRFSFKKAREAEESEIKLLENFANISKCLTSITIPVSHPINDIARNIREFSGVDEKISQSKDIQKVLNDYEIFVAAQKETFSQEALKTITTNISGTEENDLVEKSQINYEVNLRTQLLKRYFHHLKLAVIEGDISPSRITHDSINRLIDSTLLGTSSERLQEHMKLYGPEFSGPQLQDCFYTLYNSEVDCISGAFLEFAENNKRYKKGIESHAKGYLLDRLELNTKSRCVFAWADPNYTGFKPLPEEHRVPLEDLLKSRQKYMIEGISVGHNFMLTYTGDKRLQHAEGKEFRENLKMGFAFFVGTCLIDWGIAVM